MTTLRERARRAKAGAKGAKARAARAIRIFKSSITGRFEENPDTTHEQEERR